jgi:hypothetical protein
MSGGGGSDKKKTTTPTTPTAGPTMPPAQTFQPMMPGFQNMLAEQLSAGYGSGGGSVPDFAAMLASLYQPMTLGKAPGGTGTSKTTKPASDFKYGIHDRNYKKQFPDGVIPDGAK